MGIYNCASTLVEALDSLYAQTYQDFKIVLCEDGSTDDTFEVAQHELLNDDDYALPLERLDLQYLPIYWKFFFYAARKKWTLVIVLIMRCIQFIRLHG